MTLEKLINNLEKFNYSYSVTKNEVIVDLGFFQTVKIKITADKVIFKDNLKSRLTGMFNMNLKFAMFYSTVTILAVALFHSYLGLDSRAIIMVVAICSVILLWSNYYISKSHAFINACMNWLKD